MTLRHSLLGVATIAALALACAPRASKKTQQAWRPSGKVETLADGTKVICEMEKPTGSHIAEPVCRRVDDVERTAERTRNDLVTKKSERQR